MRPDNWKIFSKSGSNLNLFSDSLLNLEFISDVQNARGAEGYALTDPSGLIHDVVIVNTGWEYSPNTEVRLIDSIGDFNSILEPAEASINYIDVSVFNPNPNNSLGIGSVDISLGETFIYPSVTYASAIFTEIISTGLIETEHLTIFEESSTGTLIRPYDPINSTLVFRLTGIDNEIKLFTLDEDNQNVIWSDELIFDISEYSEGIPIVINIGFRSEDDGVYERRLGIYHRINGEDFQVAEILVNSQSIGRDERFDILAQNFGLPNPKNIPNLFKRADINEPLPDWKLLNYKGKHIVLEHDKITPYIGSYKALINAIKWLGYEDINIKEWFRNVKDNTKLSLFIPYDAKKRSKTIRSFSADERRNLKKLNELSLIYCISKETGEIDEWGNPLTENCYEYNIDEVLTKLRSLKEWLEKNIIGVNARISDITGEGVYIERFRNFIYSTQNHGNVANYSQSLTPLTLDDRSELVSGEASIGLTLKEIEETRIEDLYGLKIEDFLQYYWDPSNGAFSPEDASDLWWDEDTIAVGSPFMFPFPDLGDIQWRASVRKDEAGVIPEEFVTNPLFVYNGEVYFYNILDSSSRFYDASSNIDITIKTGFLRDPSLGDWPDSIAYSIYPNFFIRIDSGSIRTISKEGSYTVIDGSGFINIDDSSILYNNSLNPVVFIIDGAATVYPDTSTIIESGFQNGYMLESSTGGLVHFNSEFSLQPDSDPHLVYSYSNTYKIPLFTINGYKWVSSDGSVNTMDREYYLDIEDGDIKMERFILEPSSLYNYDPSAEIFRNEKYFLRFSPEAEALRPYADLDIIYTSSRMPLYLYDPSIYYFSGPDDALIIDNSIYIMSVNHIGPYTIEVFGWDGQNNTYRNFRREEYEVWNSLPTIWSYIDTSCGSGEIPILCPSALLTPEDISTLSSENLYPVFDRHIELEGITLERDSDDRVFIKIPSISYFIELPESEAISKFYNTTERVISRSGDIFTVNSKFQKFKDGDTVSIVLLDKGKYRAIAEESSTIVSVTGDDLEITGISPDYKPGYFRDVFILNDTRREVFSLYNDFSSSTFSIDVSSYDFMPNQLVALLVTDVCTGDTWGSSYRVLDVNLIPDASFIGVQHIMEGSFPQILEADPSRYTITAKHSFSSFADFYIDIDNALESNGDINLYLDDKYYHKYYLDNTFLYANILFDHEVVIDNWYDPSNGMSLVTGPFYPYARSLTIEPSTLVILDTFYDPSSYILDEKNIWTIIKRETGKVYFRVYNKSVPFIFSDIGEYDVKVESYDKFGNINSKVFESLIKVK